MQLNLIGVLFWVSRRSSGKLKTMYQCSSMWASKEDSYRWSSLNKCNTAFAVLIETHFIGHIWLLNMLHDDDWNQYFILFSFLFFPLWAINWAIIEQFVVAVVFWIVMQYHCRNRDFFWRFKLPPIAFDKFEAFNSFPLSHKYISNWI